MSSTVLATRAEAKRLINKRRTTKHNSFRVRVVAFLPTGSGKGFQGLASVQVSKKVFLETVERLLENFEARGAHVKLTLPTEDFESFYI